MTYKIIIFLLFISAAYGQIQKETTDIWQPLRYFLGKWEGYGSGKAGYGKGEREYALVLNDQYLYYSDRTVFKPQENNPTGELHEEWTIFSFDRLRKKFIIRQFNSEGFINRLVMKEMSPDTATFVFVSERMENLPKGFRGRLTYIIQNENEFTEKFELAPPGQDFQQFIKNYWKRTNAKNTTKQ